MKTLRHNSFSRLFVMAGLALATIATGCGEDSALGTGSLTVILESEDTITDGLQPGSEVESIRDGWAVSFDRYIVTIGDVDLHLATDDAVKAENADVFVVDLKKVPASGLPLWKVDGLAAGRWEFNYGTPGAAHGATRHESVSQADFDELVDRDFTYLVDGTLSKSDGQSCPPAVLAKPGEKKPNGKKSGGNDCYDAPTVRFEFGARAETTFGPCEVDEVPGFAVAEGGSQTVAVTIHGDHLFFNGFPEGDEGGISRLAQWLADCDLDLDGVVTAAELEQIKPSQLPELDDRFQLGGSPITPLDHMLDYVSAQLKTQGHFQGEGECPFDGADPH